MKKLILSIITFIVIISCSSNDGNNTTSTSTLKEIVTDSSEENIIHTKEYFFDSDGKVLKEVFNSIIFPQYNSTSTFEYDNQGRVIKEIRNNELIINVVWSGNVATLYGNPIDLSVNNALSYTFLNDKVIESHFMGDIHKFNYDENDNVISEVQADTVFVEYLDYDTTVTNPMHLIKSIGVLRMHSNPYFKNFFQTKKVYPYQDDDYSTPIQYFQFEKFVDSENRIIKIDNEENHYISRFEYN